jgi:hypothetical protein
MIKIFTLNTGDDIIAEMLDEDEENIILKNPLTIKYSVSMKGGIFVQLRYYGLFTHDDIFAFKKNSIISTSHPKQNMTEYYMLSVETAKEEFVPEVDSMIDQHIMMIKNYQMDKQLNEKTDAAFNDFLQKVTIKTLQ